MIKKMKAKIIRLITFESNEYAKQTREESA